MRVSRTRGVPDTDTRSGARRRTARRGPAFFFGLALVYLAALLLLAVGREAGFWFLDDLNDPIAGVLPLGVPWFGALGAVTLSLYGVFDHNDHWDPKWNYWHVARPLVGIVLAIVAYFIFITFIGSTGLTPRTSAVTTTSTTIAETTTTLPPTTETTDQFGFPPAEEEPSTTSPPDQAGGGPAGPSTLLPYYVLAFLVGFREGTFRNLIKRAADVLLGPGDPGAPPAGITVHPAPVAFGKVPAGGEKSVTVTVTNSGTGDLRVYPSRARAPGIDLADEHGVFSLAANAVEGATIAPGANAGLKVEFRPTAPGPYAATLTISSNAGTTPIELRGEGTEPEEQERPRPAPPRQAAGRRLLGRARRRGRRGSPSTG
jgi:Abnormal spindle-like microcephaly-assoc'd, ASPM-SPD-2-Hydin